MRWLKMSKYISNETEWEPIIYCPNNANYLISDPSLVSQIPEGLKTIEQSIFEPNDILQKIGLKGTLKNLAAGGIGKVKKSPSIKNKLIVWIRSNLFIPDARSFWIKPSINRLTKELKNQKIDAIISTGPPHSMHLIALGLKKKFGIPWIADYRDPWTFIDFFEDLDLSNWARKKHHNLEREVLNTADKVITVSNTWAKDFKLKYGVDLEVINNGFDPADFIDLKPAVKSEKFTICHIGSLNKDRSSPAFWEAISQLIATDSIMSEKLRIEIIGTVAPDLNNEIIEKNLQDYVSLINYMPHADVIKKLSEASVSLLLVNNTSNKGGIIPGKLYEYMAIGNPILCVGNKDGDSAKIVDECNAGQIADFNNVEEIRKGIKTLFDNWNQENRQSNDREKVNRYSRKSLAIKYTQKLDEIIT